MKYTDLGLHEQKQLEDLAGQVNMTPDQLFAEQEAGMKDRLKEKEAERGELTEQIARLSFMPKLTEDVSLRGLMEEMRQEQAEAAKGAKVREIWVIVIAALTLVATVIFGVLALALS